MIFNTVVSVLSFSVAALAQNAPAQGNNQAADLIQGLNPALIQQFMPQYSQVAAQFAQYASVSGFGEFQSALMSSALEFAATQTLVTAEPTGNPLADPNVMKLIGEFANTLESFIATETYLPKSVKSSVSSAVGSIVSGFSGSNMSPTTSASAEASGSSASKSGSASASETSGDASMAATASSTSSTSSDQPTASGQPTSSEAGSRSAGLSNVIVFSAVVVAGISALAVLL